MAVTDIDWALNEFRAEPRRSHYQLARAYYLGDHRQAFPTERARSQFGRLFSTFTDNLCAAVIDAFVERLELTGFTSNQPERRERENERAQIKPADPLAAAAWRIWERNRMDLRANEVHREALMMGDGYVIVWPDAAGRATFWPQEADLMTVAYDEEEPGRIARAAKVWQDGERFLRITLYYPDRIEWYRSDKPLKNGITARTNARSLSPLGVPGSADMVATDAVVPNPFGQVPVFHFPNKRLYQKGISELLDVVPLQDALTKSGQDMLVAMEFAAYKQRWATGVDVPVDEATGRPKALPWDYGAETLLTTDNPDSKFGEFSAADLTNFLEVQESLRSEIARVSGLPLHVLFITRGDFPSGEAMKSAEVRFVKKLADRQTGFGNGWEDAFTFALRVDGEDLPDDFDLNAVWASVSPRSEKEIAETLLLKKALGVAVAQLLKEAGYDDELIARMVAALPVEPSESDGGDGGGDGDGGQEQLFATTSAGRVAIPNIGVRGSDGVI